MNFSENVQNTAENMKLLEKNLLEIEELYGRMLICSSDEIEEIDNQIFSLRKNSDECLKKISSNCDEDETGMIKKAADPKAKHCDIDKETEEIFMLRQSVNAVNVRITDIIPVVRDRIEIKKEETLSMIKENNQSQGANASKYYFKEDRDSVYLTRKGKKI